MLESAGVAFAVSVPGVDEESIKETLIGKGTDRASLAEALAEAKALAVAARHPDTIVLGGDQVLVCEDRLFSKAMDRDSARQTLQALRGKDHTLISAAVLVRDARVIWRQHESATLHMRNFSEAFLDAYLTAEIPDVLGSVGCYRIEGRGTQLFERIDGDQFCIRGLPLIAILGALRQFGALSS